MAQIVGFQDIIGLGSNYGPSEVAGVQPQSGEPVLIAKNLPKSMVGIPYQQVSAGDTSDVEIDVQREFRPDRLMLLAYPVGAATGEEIDLFRVLTFSIGDTNLNASPNPVPIAVFHPQAVGTSIRAPRTTDPSLGIDMQVENGNAAGEGAIDWFMGGAVFGPSARPGGRGGQSVGAIVGAANDDGTDPGAASNADAADLPQSFVGIPYTAAPSAQGQRVSINCKVFRDIRPDRLAVGYGAGVDWMIRDVRVGTTSLNASTNPIPSACFSPLSFGNRLRATVTATPSVGITIDAYSLQTGANTDAFCGAFFGPSRFPNS